MRIAVLGSGAMGSLFGGYLSRYNDVWLIDIDKLKIDIIKGNGVKITEKDEECVFFPNAVASSKNLEPMDLIIVFVKAMYSKSALCENQHLIGKNTYVMTLQNGSGHEETLLEFVPRERIIIGSTQHNSSLIAPGHIHHGGGGLTRIGLLGGNSEKLRPIAENFTKCGFDTVVSNNVRKQIWDKLLLNTSASVLTAILQVPLGYMLDNPHGWHMTEMLIREAVEVANADGLDFDFDNVISNVRTVLTGAHSGYTSIYSDLRDGVRTEVDTISGSVVKTARRLNIPVPVHEFVVELVHAMEEKPRT